MNSVTRDTNTVDAFIGTKSPRSKLERYGWTLRDSAPGQMQSLPKHDLWIDPQYQRERQEAKIFKMAKAWSWIACGVILVGERSGRYYVIDGQHRVLAARKRSDIDTLPCIVFPTETVEEEASAFLTTNTFRATVPAASKFKALLCAGDDAAMLVARLIEEAGRIPSNTTGRTTVQCLSLLLRLATQKPKTLETIWPVVTELCREHGLPHQIVAGFIYIEEHLPQGTSVRDTRVRELVLRAGYHKIWDHLDRSVRAYASKPSPEKYADSIVEVLNHGIRNKIALEKRAGQSEK